MRVEWLCLALGFTLFAASCQNQSDPGARSTSAIAPCVPGQGATPPGRGGVPPPFADCGETPAPSPSPTASPQSEWRTGWNAVSDMATPRNGHTGTLLSDGRILVAGGFSDGSQLSVVSVETSAEIFDPSTRAWTLAGPMLQPRGNHTATLLPDGRVLVVGGHAGASVLGSAEIYDPATDQWTSAGSIAPARHLHSAALLSNGKVLIAGGTNASPAGFTSALLFDPVSGTWANTASMAQPRYQFASALLDDGRFLAAGGYGSGYLASAETYDPWTASWSAAGSLSVPRQHPVAMPSGSRVVVAGGLNGSGILSSSEVFDPATSTWRPGPPLSASYMGSGVSLSDGSAAIFGGLAGPESSAAAARLAAGSSWVSLAPMSARRMLFPAVAFDGGTRVFVCGGASGSAVAADAEVLQMP